MASKIGESMRGTIILTPHCGFLKAARVAWNEMHGLDSLHNEGWDLVSQHTPHVVAPPVEAIEDHQGGNGDGENGSDGEEESNFEGYGSDDSEETVHYPDPEETVPYPLEDTENDGGEFAETV